MPKKQWCCVDRKIWEKKMEPWEKAKELLDRISRPFAIDDAPNIYVHIDEEGDRMLVSIPENEENET